MFEFAIKASLDSYDLDTAEGRISALRSVVPILSSIRDKALRPEYVRLTAGWLGIEQDAVTEALRASASATKSPNNRDGSRSRQRVSPEVVGPAGWPRPDASSTAVAVEHEALKCALQIPQHCAAWYTTVEPQAFTAKVHLAMHEAITNAGGPGSRGDGREWIQAVLDVCSDDEIRAYVREYTVDPLHIRDTDDERIRDYAAAVMARLLEMDATRRAVELKGRLQRTSPTEHQVEYNKLFAELTALEQYRRQMRERALGGN
jgi:DNA primase